MSSHYFYGEVEFSEESEAKRFCITVDKWCISKEYKNDGQTRFSSLPDLFIEEDEKYCIFDYCYTDGVISTFSIDATFELTEKEALDEFAEYLAGKGAIKGLIAYEYTGADYTPEFFELVLGKFENVYTFSQDENIDSKLLNGSEKGLELEEVFKNIQINEVEFPRSIISDQNKLLETLTSILKDLKSPELFDDRSIDELGDQNFLANRLRDDLKEKLINLDNSSKEMFEEYIYYCFFSGVNAAIGTLQNRGLELSIQGTQLDEQLPHVG